MKVVNMVLADIKLAFISCLFLLIGSCMSSQRYFNKDHAALFVFGDSLLDPGNNRYIINSTRLPLGDCWPYGESYFDHPTGRLTNGRTIADFIAEYARLPLIPAYLDPSLRTKDFVYGANFASAGAGILDDTHVGWVINLKTQIEYLGDLEKRFRKNFGDAKTEQLLSNAVYLFSCGGNDIDNILPYTYEQHIEMVMGNLTTLLKGIYDKGGRKFAIFNLAQPACFPNTRVLQPQYTCNKEYNIMTSIHNQKLYKKLEELEKKWEGFLYAIFDYRTAISNRMNNPSRYGFKVGDTACCGSGPFRGISTCGLTVYGVQEFELCDNVNDYVFFDSAHPTEGVCRQLADMFWNGDSNVTITYNLKTLFQVRRFPKLLSNV